MEQTTLARIVGPYGLHAWAGAALVVFLGFLWMFNFTTFFNGALN